jgi:pilus assembly protein CpaF
VRSHQQAVIEDIEAEIGESVDFVIHIERQPGRRTVREIMRLSGYDRRRKDFICEPVFSIENCSTGFDPQTRKEK